MFAFIESVPVFRLRAKPLSGKFGYLPHFVLIIHFERLDIFFEMLTLFKGETLYAAACLCQNECSLEGHNDLMYLRWTSVLVEA